MLIPLHEIRIIFDKIAKKSLDGGTSVVILCSYEVDSLCAVQILTVDIIFWLKIKIVGFAEK